MMAPIPVQISGSEFLTKRRTALLADQCRCGKTGSAILAANNIEAVAILVLTTASGRSVWRRAFGEWGTVKRSVAVLGVDRYALGGSDVLIASYEATLNQTYYAGMLAARWDLLILDEDHRVANPDAKRTQRVYGALSDGGAILNLRGAIANRATRVWHLSGTPVSHDLGNMWMRLRSSHETCLHTAPNVISYNAFRERYCVIVQKEVAPYKFVPVVVKGKNEAELRARIGDWMLRRTQKDVGIRPPSYSILPMIAGPADLRRADGDLRKEDILRAAAAGDTRDLEMHMGPLRRLTGAIKAKAVVPAVKDFFEDGKGKLVLAYWHREVGDILEEEMGGLNLVRVDGSTSAKDREQYEQRFRDEPLCTLFLAQIDAAGEAIDLSAADELWFVETTFSPRAMYQMSCRIANVGKPRSVFVKVATLEGSIDEVVQERLMALWASINQVVT
jgi:SWI/SNF-related matrix-associated actin-dependent regulator of chromatin subfamily A-like protein 1